MPAAKKAGVDALADDAVKEPVEETKPEAPVEAKEPAPSPYDNELAGFKQFDPSIRRTMGYDAEADPRVVKNVPADMTTSWATDPRIDNGQHLTFMRGLGFRPVRKEEVSTSPFSGDKMFLGAYEVGPHDYVVVGGGVLLIGYRDYRDERRHANTRASRDQLDSKLGALDNAGIEHTGSVRSGPLSEVM